MKEKGFKKRVFALIVSFAMVVAFVPIVEVCATRVQHYLITDGMSQGEIGQRFLNVVVSQETQIGNSTIFFETTLGLVNSITNQEIVMLAGVPVLITTYDLGHTTITSGTILENLGGGVLRALPSGQQVENSQNFGSALNAFIEGLAPSPTQIGASSSYIEIEPYLMSRSGHHRRSQMFPSPSSNRLLSFGMNMSFDYEVRWNTNWGNPLWDWDRAWIRNMHITFQLFDNSTNATNAEFIEINQSMSAVSAIGGSISLSSKWGFGFDVSPPNDSSPRLMNHRVNNTTFVTITSHMTGSVYRSSTVIIPNNLATIETFATIGLRQGSGVNIYVGIAQYHTTISSHGVVR